MPAANLNLIPRPPGSVAARRAGLSCFDALLHIVFYRTEFCRSYFAAVKCRPIKRQYVPCHKSRQPLRATTLHCATRDGMRHIAPDKDRFILKKRKRQLKINLQLPLLLAIFNNRPFCPPYFPIASYSFSIFKPVNKIPN